MPAASQAKAEQGFQWKPEQQAEALRLPSGMLSGFANGNPCIKGGGGRGEGGGGRGEGGGGRGEGGYQVVPTLDLPVATRAVCRSRLPKLLLHIYDDFQTAILQHHHLNPLPVEFFADQIIRVLSQRIAPQ